MHHSSKTFGLLLSLLLAVCLFGHIAQAKHASGGMATSAETSTYVFVPGQSKVVQTGGIAGVHWTYSIKGQFQLAVDPNAGSASFAHVDANAVEDNSNLDLNRVFNMTSLAGTVEPSGSIKFTGKASDGSDVRITVTLADDLAHLIGQTTPPPNSADFFIFSLDAVAQRKYSGGSGTPDDPYQIATAEDLIALGETPEDYDKHFILTADIDLDPNLPGGKVFDKAVIAPGIDQHWMFHGTPFTGCFDGAHHTISRLTIVGEGHLGLFGQLGRFGAHICEVKNLGLVDVNLTLTGSGVRSVGGLVGANVGAVTQCYSTGVVTGTLSVGGLVGVNIGTVTQCWTRSEVSGDEYWVGGLVGENGGVVTDCYSASAVRGNVAVGGLVGKNEFTDVSDGYDGTVANCYNTGAVHGKDWVGGLAGDNSYGALTQSYSTGTVHGESHVGGLVGGRQWTNRGTVTYSFWDIQASGQATSDGGTGKTTAEMQMASTFLDAGWDFVNVWGIGENQTYPYLRKYSAADINQDASVNFLDLAVLAEKWLTDISHR